MTAAVTASTNSPKGTALVTGASSGIGAVYADRLARRGFDLILVARNRERLEALAAKLVRETGRKVEVLPADLTNRQDIAQVEAALRSRGDITMLVNNAGFGAAAPLLASDVDKMEEMIALNVSVLTRLTYAAVPGFVERGAGTLVNIASIVAISPETLNGVYGGSKAFVLALSQSLQHELKDKGVRVQAVLPGATATEFWGVAGVPMEHLPKEIVMTAQDMVDAALAGLDQGEQVTIPALPDLAEWEAFDAARRAMSARLSSTAPAARYRVSAGSATSAA
ncbi:SDR family oxidoreductase [Variovorax atrisoli]|uniref:SDR family NAD(P)-dependent oxidoreductase n=1 Tax=Variovorax atrisoli TaxID=3394203 RepID=UPI000F7D85E1|nr:SDR family oxidoreductase [Variovorax sp. 369]RTD86728.1 SDR family oxidoreductase [Variovorax sp. 369]